MNRLFTFILLCVAASSVGIYMSLPQIELSFGAFTLSRSNAEEETATDKKQAVSFVGDIMLARNVEYLMRAYGHFYPFAELPEHQEEAYLVGNFEGAVPKKHVPTQSMQFSFSIHPDFIAGLREYGFTHLGLANNHAYDFGVDDFRHTEALLEDSSFDVFGDPGSLSTSSVALLELDGGTVALVGIYALYQKPSTEAIGDVFAYADAISDVQIAYVHWGEEYVPIHNDFQETLAHALIDAGADAIIGHHPHVVQDIGLYKGSPIFYSLGNFIFDQYFSEEVQTGLMATFSFDSDMLRFELVPATSIGTRSVVRHMAGYERDEFLEGLAQKSHAELEKMITEGELMIEQ